MSGGKSEMFARNERYADAGQPGYGAVGHLRYEPAFTDRSFGLSGLMRSLRERLCLADVEKTIVLDLGHGPLVRAVRYENEILGDAANENGFIPVTEKNNR
tara:strand:- start:175 stop:477 length:303 start_codon:yes stop_codon:yes gene_type:complete